MKIELQNVLYTLQKIERVSRININIVMANIIYGSLYKQRIQSTRKRKGKNCGGYYIYIRDFITL